jgi:hypothetical protein
MSGDIELTLEGVPALVRKLDNPTWAYGPMGSFLNRWAIKVQTTTRKN